MATELQQQISKIKEGNVFLKPSHLSKPSLFLTEKEAAGIDTEIVYDACIKALTTLSQYDSRFDSYLEDILHSSSINFQRELKTSDENKILDAKLNKLLIHLSLFASTSESHRVLEYLIRRYRVHELNVNGFLSCLLPLHDTKIFARAVQLSRISNSSWSFLSGVKESGSPLPRNIIVSRCKKDLNILSILCDVVRSPLQLCLGTVLSSKLQEGMNKIISFFTVTMLEFLETSSLSDNQVRELLPFILEGISLFSKLSEFSSSSYSISALLSDTQHPFHQIRRSCYLCIIQISRHSKLSDQLCFTLVKALLTATTEIMKEIDEDDMKTSNFGNMKQVLYESMSPLIIISHYQDLILTRSLMKIMFPSVDDFSFLHVLQFVSQSCDISRFLKFVVKSLFAEYTMSYQSLVDSSKGTFRALRCELVTSILRYMISKGIVSQEILFVEVSGCLNCLFDLVALKDKSEDNISDVEALQVLLLDLIKSISQRFPDSFDLVLREVLSGKPKSNSNGTMESLISNIYEQSPHRKMETDGSNLLLSLTHPSSLSRVVGLNKFAQITISSDNSSLEFGPIVNAVIPSLTENSEARFAAWKPAVLSNMAVILSPSEFFSTVVRAWEHWRYCLVVEDALEMMSIILQAINTVPVLEKMVLGSCENINGAMWLCVTCLSLSSGVFRSIYPEVKHQTSLVSLEGISLKILSSLDGVHPAFTSFKGCETMASLVKIMTSAMETKDALTRLLEECGDFLLSSRGIKSFYQKCGIVLFFDKLRAELSNSGNKSCLKSLLEIEVPLVLALLFEKQISQSQRMEWIQNVISSLIFIDAGASFPPLKNLDSYVSVIGTPLSMSCLVSRIIIALLHDPFHEFEEIVGPSLSILNRDLIPLFLLQVLFSPNVEGELNFAFSRSLVIQVSGSDSLVVKSEGRSRALLVFLAFLQAQMDSFGSKTPNVSSEFVGINLWFCALAMVYAVSHKATRVRRSGISLAAKILSWSSFNSMSIQIQNFCCKFGDVAKLAEIVVNVSSSILLDARGFADSLLHMSSSMSNETFLLLLSFFNEFDWSFSTCLNSVLAVVYAAPLNLSFQPLVRFINSALISSPSKVTVYFDTLKTLTSNLVLSLKDIGSLSEDHQVQFVNVLSNIIANPNHSSPFTNSIKLHLRQAFLEELSKDDSCIVISSLRAKNLIYRSFVLELVSHPGDRLLSLVISKITVELTVAQDMLLDGLKQFDQQTSEIQKTVVDSDMMDAEQRISGLADPLGRLTTLLEALTPCFASGISPNDSPVYAALAIVLVNLFSRISHPVFQSVITVDYCQCLILELLTISIKMSEDFIRQYKTTSKKGSSKNKTEDVYHLSRVNSDLKFVLSTISASKSLQLQTAGLGLLEVMLSLSPSSIELVFESLGVLLSTASRDSHHSSGLLLERIVKTMVSICEKNTSFLPQSIVSSLFLHIVSVTNTMRGELCNCALQIIGYPAIPIVVDTLLVHVVKAYDFDSFSESSSSSSTVISSQDTPVYILLSRAAQRRAVRDIRTSICEELFSLAVHESVTLPALLQVNNLISQVKVAVRIFQNAANIPCHEENPNVVVYDKFSVDVSQFSSYLARLASSPSLSAASILPLGMLILEYVVEVLQNKTFHKNILAIAQDNSPQSIFMEKNIQLLFIVFVESILELLALSNNLIQCSGKSGLPSTYSIDLLSSRNAATSLSGVSLGKTLWSQSLLILEHLQRLLDGPTFIQILEELLSHEDPNVRQRALIIMNQRLEHMSESVESEKEIPLLLDLASKLKESLKASLSIIVNNCGQSSFHNLDHQIGLAQSSVLCIDSIARFFLNRHDANAINSTTSTNGKEDGNKDRSLMNRDAVMMATLTEMLDISLQIEAILTTKSSVEKQSPSKVSKKSKLTSSEVEENKSKSYPSSLYSGLVKLIGSSFLSISTLSGAVGAKSLVVLSKLMSSFFNCMDYFNGNTWVENIAWKSSDSNSNSTKDTILLEKSMLSKSRMLLLRSIIAAISGVVSHLPGFFHPYLHRLYSTYFSLGTAEFATFSRSDLEILWNDMESCLQIITEKIPCRLLVPSLTSVAPTLLSSSSTVVAWRFLSFLRIFGSNLERNDIVQYLSPLCSLLTMAMDYHRIHRLKSDVESISDIHRSLSDQVDDLTIEATLDICLKLTESELSSYLSRLAEWRDINITAVNSSVNNASHKVNAQFGRSFMYYRLMAALANKLKTLFCPFMEMNWKNAMECVQQFFEFCQLYARRKLGLNARIEDVDSKKSGKKRKMSGSNNTMGMEDKSLSFGIFGVLESEEEIESTFQELHDRAGYVLDALHVSIKNDFNGLIEESRYVSIMPAIVNCLCIREAFPQDVSYFQFCDDHVVPTITAMSKAAPRDTFWKPLNRKLLLLTKDRMPATRIAAVKVLRTLFEEVGEEYLLLLPECLPYLSELLEDDDSSVVSVTSAAIRAIEDLSGEQLDSYLQ